nr:hypothetical protein CAGL0G03993g [Nakaseomyces glabratus]
MPLLVYKILFSTELCYAPRCDWEYLSQPCHTRKPTFSVLWDSRAILGEETKRVTVTGSASIFSIFSIIFQLIVRGDYLLVSTYVHGHMKYYVHGYMCISLFTQTHDLHVQQYNRVQF